MKKLLCILVAFGIQTTLFAQTFTATTADGVKIKYEITSVKEKTVQVIGGDRPYKLIIPATVDYRDVKYRVTAIKSKAFAMKPFGNRMFALVLPEGIEEIGEKAFYKVFADEIAEISLYIPSSVKFIGNYCCPLKVEKRKIMCPQCR